MNTEPTTPAPVGWIDGHPQLEAIAATVWERCRTEGTSLVVDDPRNIAVAALAALPVPSAPTSAPTVLRERVADVLAAADGWTWAPGFDRRRSPAYQAYLTRAGRVVGLLAAYDTTMRAAVQAEAFHDAADEIETQQAHIEHKERDEHGNLDHETELQGDAVRGMAKYLRTRAAGLRRLAAGAQQPEPETAERPRCPHCQMPHDLTPGVELACASIRASIRDAGAQQPECTASTSGACLREAQSETACDTEGGECVHGGRPAGAQQQPTTETPRCSDPTCTCVQVDAGGRCECIRWESRPQPSVSPVEAAERLAARHHADGWPDRAQGAQDVADLLRAGEREERHRG